MFRAGLLAIALCACGRFGFDSTSTRDATASMSGDAVGGDGGNVSMTDAAVIVGGGAWTTFASSPGATDLYSMWGFGQTDVWVGGAAGFTRQFDGTQWITKTGFTGDVNMLWASSPTDMWAVGTQCEVKRWTGLAFTTITVPGCSNQSYFAVAGLSSTDVWVVGVGGRIDHMTGNLNWASFPQGNNVDFWSVAPVSATNAYFVGTKGTIKHWTGSTFLDESIAQNIILTSVWAASATDVWAVGATGLILHKTGAGAFTQVTSPTTQFLYWIWGTAANDIWAVGATGTILHYDGTSWGLVASPVTTTLRMVGRVNGNGLRIVGHGGVVLTHP